YVDDVLIYLSSLKANYKKKVRTVIKKLRKCKFSVKQVKYLGFIIKAEKGIVIDEEKLRAIYK
ncbi:hypothetical protein K504DRAFT_375122, partial [Pleomassaria siparia CBS 279.74]